MPAQVLGSLTLAGEVWMTSGELVDERTAVRCSGRDTVGNGVKPFPEGKPYRGTIAAVKNADSDKERIIPTNSLVHSHAS